MGVESTSRTDSPITTELNMTPPLILPLTLLKTVLKRRATHQWRAVHVADRNGEPDKCARYKGIEAAGSVDVGAPEIDVVRIPGVPHESVVLDDITAGALSAADVQRRAVDACRELFGILGSGPTDLLWSLHGDACRQ